MFPSKLYEVQLSPPQKKYSCNSIFMEDLALDKPTVMMLLESDGKEIVEEPPKPLQQLIQEHFETPFHLEAYLMSRIQQRTDVPAALRQRLAGPPDEIRLLMMASFVFATKIVLYQEHKFNLRSQIINFGYRAKLYLVKIESRYQLVRPTNKSKLSLNQVPHFDMLVLDDEKPREEETKAFEGSTLPSSKGDAYEDLFTPPKPTKAYLSQSQEEARPKNELLASLSICPQATRYTGKLKFYDEQKSYGFIVMDLDGSDIFVHSDDLLKAGVSKDILKSPKQGYIIRFSFACLSYIGKYKKSRKAVDLVLLNGFPTPYFPLATFQPTYQFFEPLTYRNFNYTQ